ncbi:MAG: hypothetical protein R6V08_09790 [Desulfuromonadales bacterium]
MRIFFLSFDEKSLSANSGPSSLRPHKVFPEDRKLQQRASPTAWPALQPNIASAPPFHWRMFPTGLKREQRPVLFNQLRTEIVRFRNDGHVNVTSSLSFCCTGRVDTPVAGFGALKTLLPCRVQSSPLSGGLPETMIPALFLHALTPVNSEMSRRSPDFPETECFYNEAQNAHPPGGT